MWLSLAIGSLVPAGLFALIVALVRTPPFSRHVHDPRFFRRCLVVHVDLALIVWSYSFLVALYWLLPGRTDAQQPRMARSAAMLGVGLLMLGAALPGAEPLLSNYVPAIDHPAFLAGLAIFGLSVAAALLDGRLLATSGDPSTPVELPPSAQTGLRAAAVLVLVALSTIVASWMATPSGLDRSVRHELVVWGGGHLLQGALQCAMLAVWLTLVQKATATDPMAPATASWVFGALVLSALGASLCTLPGTTSTVYRVGFTRWMQWAIFPTSLVVLGACVRALARAPSYAARLRDARVVGFVVSALLACTGFVLGALIRGSTTLVPAHYHAATGAVTVSFMVMAVELLEPLGLAAAQPSRRALARWQPAVYGLGQFVFVCGFALAGAHGMARKAYGDDQHLRSASDYVGLGLMGLGGVVAALGGLLFLGLVVAARRSPIGPDLSLARSAR